MMSFYEISPCLCTFISFSWRLEKVGEVAMYPAYGFYQRNSCRSQKTCSKVFTAFSSYYTVIPFYLWSLSISVTCGCSGNWTWYEGKVDYVVFENDFLLKRSTVCLNSWSSLIGITLSCALILPLFHWNYERCAYWF